MSPAPPVDERWSEADETGGRLLLVSLQDTVVALPAAPVVEILPARPYARLPGAAAAIAGVVNRRGRMLTVVDLGIALGSRPAAVGDEHRIVVVSYAGKELGLAVHDVLQITAEWLSGAPQNGDPEVEPDGSTPAATHERMQPEMDEQLAVIELDTLLAPLFGDGDHRVGATTWERS